MSIKNEGASFDDEKGGLASDPYGEFSAAPPGEPDAMLRGLGESEAERRMEEHIRRLGPRVSRTRPGNGKKCPSGYLYFHEFKSCRRPEVVGKGAMIVEESGNAKIGRWFYQVDSATGEIVRGKPKRYRGKKGIPTRTEEQAAAALAPGCPVKIATGEVATTYASLSSCPVSCPLLGYGCYSNGGMVMMTMLELNESCVSAKQCALDEAEAIREFAGRGIPRRGAGNYRVPPMRLHTAGDCATTENARIVSAATDEYIDAFYRQPGFSMLPGQVDPRTGREISPLPPAAQKHKHGLDIGAAPVWGYTHAWREIPREAWGKMSILASCNTTAEVIEAAERGYYMTSLVVPYFSHMFKVHGPRFDCNPYQGMQMDVARKRDYGRYTLIEHVCPAQIHEHVSCSNCQLCWREEFFAKQSQKRSGARIPLHVIMLEVHGTEEDQASEVAADSGVQSL